MKIQIIVGIIVLVLLAAILIFVPKKDSVVIEDTETQPAAPNAEVSVPNINPVSKANPFAGIKINPFE